MDREPDVETRADIDALQVLPGDEAQLLTGHCGPLSCRLSCQVTCHVAG
jgi:hypothetical protein